MQNRNIGNNAPPNSPRGDINKDKSLNNKGKDKKPKQKSKKLTKKPENQKPKVEQKKLPPGFSALESCRISKLNKLSQYAKMRKGLIEYAKGVRSSRWARAIETSEALTENSFASAAYNPPAPADPAAITWPEQLAIDTAKMTFGYAIKDAGDRWKSAKIVRDKMIGCLEALTDESILNACRRHVDWPNVQNNNDLIAFLRILLTVCRR